MYFVLICSLPHVLSSDLLLVSLRSPISPALTPCIFHNLLVPHHLPLSGFQFHSSLQLNITNDIFFIHSSIGEYPGSHILFLFLFFLVD